MFPSNLEAVLFDAGGTLVRIDYAFIAAAARDLGYSVTEDALLRGEAAARLAIDARADLLRRAEDTDASRIPSYFETLLHGAGLAADGIGPVLRAMEADHVESNLWRVPLQGAEETLRSLRQRGVRTAVVSNSDGRIRGILTELGLAEHVELVLDSHEEGVEKPDPVIFHRALRRLEVPPERAAYIGDIYSIDAVGARTAGLLPVLIDPTGAYDDADCTTVAGLLELLKGFG